ncbi:MAG TPA: histidine kinase dimerization/phospho-acceptor domain-containing protein [Terracidiphilus sp.]|nr:histidine kinase dimerization/phospho-acceptor domain-containing protein [Terracidiphilus sp.]
MIEFTRDELRLGLIDWREITAPEFLERDQKAIEQLRNYGVALPYEKTFVLRNGKRVDFLTGAVRLSEKPFTLVSYTIDVSEANRLRRVKHELQARQKVIHQLAHELNNPLAALTLLLHLVITSGELAADTRELLEQAVLQLNRISDTVREVVAQTREASHEDTQN